MPTEEDWHDLCALNDIDEEEPHFVNAGGRELMVVRVGDEVSVRIACGLKGVVRVGWGRQA